ncbi:MICOS complex subunit MIC10-like [Carex rostrata]
MADQASKKPYTLPQSDLDKKWDACIDLSIRRVLYSSLAGAFSGLIFFRSPTSRWASVTLGLGVGIGSAYTECSYLLNGSPPKWPLTSSAPPPPPASSPAPPQSATPLPLPLPSQEESK